MQNISRVTAWSFAGKHYPTEILAVEANVKAIGDNIIRSHADNALRGMLESAQELSALLSRHVELRECAEEETPEPQDESV